MREKELFERAGKDLSEVAWISGNGPILNEGPNTCGEVGNESEIFHCFRMKINSMVYFCAKKFRIPRKGAGHMTEKKESVKGSRPKKTANEKVKFEFAASEAQEVFLAGDFNDWDTSMYPMKRDKKGVWKTTLPLAPGRYEYRFLVDGQWENDPSCSCCVPNQFGSMNCLKTVE